jgi:hypothetical protein
MESNTSKTIDLRDFEDLNYWAQQFGVTRERIIRAAHTVGPDIYDVRREVAETD